MKQQKSSSTNSPASQHRVDDERDVGRLLADGSAKVVVPPLADQQQLCQAGGKDGTTQQSAAEDERQEEAVVPLQCMAQVVFLQQTCQTYVNGSVRNTSRVPICTCVI